MMPTPIMTPTLMPAFAPGVSPGDEGAVESERVGMGFEVAGLVRMSGELGIGVEVKLEGVVLGLAAVEDGDEDDSLEVVQLCDGSEEVEIEKSVKADGAGALNFLPFGWSQSMSPVEFVPQHCQRDVVALYTTSGCGWSPKRQVSLENPGRGSHANAMSRKQVGIS